MHIWVFGETNGQFCIFYSFIYLRKSSNIWFNHQKLHLILAIMRSSFRFPSRSVYLLLLSRSSTCIIIIIIIIFIVVVVIIIVIIINLPEGFPLFSGFVQARLWAASQPRFAWDWPIKTIIKLKFKLIILTNQIKTLSKLKLN